MSNLIQKSQVISNLIQRYSAPLIGPRFGLFLKSFHTTSIQRSDEVRKLRFAIRYKLAEQFNLEHNPKIISLTTKYVKKPTIEGQFVFRNAIAIMFDRLTVELKTTKPVVLILLTLMAQNGGSYYQRYLPDHFHQNFRYKEFQLSIHQALDALTEGVTGGKERSYDAFKKRSDLTISRKPILQNVFVELRDDIASVAYVGRVAGDLFRRVEHDERKSNQFVFSKEIRKDLCYFVWVSSFQMDNPNCPEEIRNWVQQNWSRFLLDPMLNFDKMIQQEGSACVVDKVDTICIAARTQEEPASSVGKADTICDAPSTQEEPANALHQMDTIDNSRYFIRFDTLENLNLENDSKLIAMVEQYVFKNKPTKENPELKFRQAVEAMLNQLGLEIGASKEIVLILLTIMAQYGASYYQTVRTKALYDTFWYKNYHLTGIEVLNALTKAITSDSVSLYEELKIAQKANRRIPKTRLSLFRVFVELQDIIYYIAYLGRLRGDLYFRVLEDNTNTFTELGKQNPRYYVWLSSFQIDNPSCPLEIRAWLKTNRYRFMLDPKCHRIQGQHKKNKS